MAPTPVGIEGHEAVKATLRRLRAGSLLFAGPPSVGRRRMAAWYAAWCNCEAPGEEPCGACDSCRAAAQGAHPDLLEKGPSGTTRGGRERHRQQVTIDQLVPRSFPGADPEPLSRFLEARPRHRRRVGVVDAAETLTPGAANAFLKMLEEPPAWATVVLIAPSPQALLPTLASRCVPLRFGAAEVGAFEDLAPHPAYRAGRYGALLRDRQDPEGHAELREAAEAWIDALDAPLAKALTAAEALESAWAERRAQAPGDLLRELLRERDPGRYREALDALDATERALETFVKPKLAFYRLTLRLRAAGVRRA